MIFHNQDAKEQATEKRPLLARVSTNLLALRRLERMFLMDVLIRRPWTRHVDEQWIGQCNGACGLMH